MFKPTYTLSPKLLGYITKIERLYGQLEALRVPYKIELKLRRDNLVKASYVSNSIEGNPLSLPEVTNLLLGDRVPVNRDEKEVTNYFEILDEMESLNETQIGLELSLSLHKRLLSGVQDEIGGKIRNKQVIIGKYVPDGELEEAVLRIKHEPPTHKAIEIKKLLEELFIWVRNDRQFPAIIQAGIFHHHFVYIHPFEDGNGRVCRLLAVLLLRKRGYQINKYFILDDFYDIDRIMYSDKLHSADSGDKTEWLEYFAEGVMFSLQAALGKVEKAVDGLRVINRPTPREKEVLDLMRVEKELTTSQVSAQLKVTRQQAHHLLRGLVEKNFLEKIGATKSSYYILK
ncbi:Fic family protein [Patescibacteria group bacterium]|nr:Fic family protein [Patescibacteria group bacterium]